MDKCPTCGMDCEVVGEVTKHYEPILATEEEIRNIIVKEGVEYNRGTIKFDDFSFVAQLAQALLGRVKAPICETEALKKASYVEFKVVPDTDKCPACKGRGSLDIPNDNLCYLCNGTGLAKPMPEMPTMSLREPTLRDIIEKLKDFIKDTEFLVNTILDTKNKEIEELKKRLPSRERLIEIIMHSSIYYIALGEGDCDREVNELADAIMSEITKGG